MKILIMGSSYAELVNTGRERIMMALGQFYSHCSEGRVVMEALNKTELSAEDNA
jgi:hypothetical protein